MKQKNVKMVVTCDPKVLVQLRRIAELAQVSVDVAASVLLASLLVLKD